MRSQIVIASRRNIRALPYAFTEQGVAMLSSVLRSTRAVEVNIAIMRTFVQLRRLMDSNRANCVLFEIGVHGAAYRGIEVAETFK
jgi:hypothetical protein